LKEWRDDVFDWLAAHRLQALVCHHSLWTPERLQEARARRLWRLSYTVNEEVIAQKLWHWGHDAIITDRVDAFDPRR
jgi:glycerophosphoryl diester phosphodiesterase